MNCALIVPSFETHFVHLHGNRNCIQFQVRILSSHTNIRFLRTPQRTARFVAVRKAIMNKNKQLQRLRMKLSSAVETDGILVDDELANDLHQVVNNKSDHESVFKDDEFKRIFWDQQVLSYCVYVYFVLMLGCCM